MNKQHKLLASLIFFNLAPSLFLPNLALKEMISKNLVKPDSTIEAQATSIPQIDPKINVIIITAYSSTPEQTDSTPFITASGSLVEDGIVACNFLAFNTRIRLPELYGDKIFTVKDRMAKKNSHKIDIWFPTTEQAKQFGVQKTRIEIIES
ncbi:MAG: hypothetical protein Q8N22_01315 [bacterium]|nr:hypothetical protein [bacterium]